MKKKSFNTTFHFQILIIFVVVSEQITPLIEAAKRCATL